MHQFTFGCVSELLDLILALRANTGVTYEKEHITIFETIVRFSESSLIRVNSPMLANN